MSRQKKRNSGRKYSEEIGVSEKEWVHFFRRDNSIWSTRRPLLHLVSRDKRESWKRIEVFLEEVGAVSLAIVEHLLSQPARKLFALAWKISVVGSWHSTECTVLVSWKI